MTTASAERTLRAGPAKQATVAELTEKLRRSTSTIVTEYRGLTVKQLADLRTSLRQQNVEYVVVKNTLARRAAVDAGIGDLAEALVGPVAIAVGYDDISTPAKLVSDYARITKLPTITRGFAEGRLLGTQEVKMLAELPPRDVLLGQLAGTLASPLTSLAGSLNSICSTFASTLDAYRAKLEAA